MIIGKNNINGETLAKLNSKAAEPAKSSRGSSMGLAPLFCLRWCSAHRRTVFLRRCIAAALVASGATLLLFQTKLAAHESMLLPPWIRPSAGPPGRQEEREGRTERDRRIMERQIFRCVCG
ncbi:uncharacterized protein LOC144175174 [Haemaphysalis longicornis]